MRILVIEDDERLTGVLERALDQEGYDVISTSEGETGEKLLRAGNLDALILDLGLPDRDGLAVLESLRDRGSSLPVLVLTGRDTVDERVKGLDAGADDYLIKPFALNELLARMRSLLRRGAGAEPILRYADLELDPSRGTALRGGKRLDLRPREFGLLHFFMKHPEQTLTRDRIYEGVWETRHDGLTNVLEVYIRYLRTHLEHRGPRLIHTVRGKGYILRHGESA